MSSAARTGRTRGTVRPGPEGPEHMVIVAGHLEVDPDRREAYLADCVAVVEAARRAPGCLEYAITADLVDPSRIVVLERWESRTAVAAFRGRDDGPPGPPPGVVRGGAVAEHDVVGTRILL